MKRKIKLLALVLAICLTFAACSRSSGSSSYDDTYYGGDDANNAYSDSNNGYDGTQEQTESITNPVREVPLNITLDSEGFVPLNENGIIELKKYSGTANLRERCVKEWDDKKIEYKFVYKHTDEPTPRISKNSEIGVYDDISNITLLPLSGVSPKYTVPLNFYEFDSPEEVSEHPHGLYRIHFSDYVNDEDKNCNLLYGNSGGTKKLEECNGENLESFVSKQANVFHENRTPFSGYKLIDAERYEEFTFGGYDGTVWEEFTIKAIVEYYEIYSNRVSIPVERTKNGYFKVDFSGLDSGKYYVIEYDSMIELV